MTLNLKKKQHIPIIHPPEFKLNKANTLNLEIPLLDSNMNIIDFLLINLHLVDLGSLGSHHTVFTLLNLFDLLGVAFDPSF